MSERCSAKSKRSQEQCKRWATPGRRVCHYHGGATPRPGPDHPNWRHGKRSKYLPAQLAAKYESAESDPNLALFRQDLALLEMRLGELLSSGESEMLWRHAVDGVTVLRAALLAGDSGGILAAVRDLENLAARGVSDSLRWGDVYKTLELLTKIKTAEFKRLAAANEMISSQELLIILGHISQTARDCFRKYPDDWRRFCDVIRTYDTESESEWRN